MKKMNFFFPCMEYFLIEEVSQNSKNRNFEFSRVCHKSTFSTFQSELVSFFFEKNNYFHIHHNTKETDNTHYLNFENMPLKTNFVFVWKIELIDKNSEREDFDPLT